MSKKELPKMGDVIPVQNFHVSKTNVRAEEPFGETNEDRALIDNLRRGRIIGPFKARPEGNGYGVVVGRRRFLAKEKLGAESFKVGVDVLVEEMSEAEAREISLIENLDILRQEMDPVTRAKRLNEIISSSPGGLRSTAGRLGISPSTLSEWLKVLELSPKMQESVSKNLLFYTDALKVARMDLGQEAQEDLAKTLETEGFDAFQKEVERRSEKRLKRGIPAGKYIFVKISWDKVYKPDMQLYTKLEKLAAGKHQKVDEYCKGVLEDHAKAA